MKRLGILLIMAALIAGMAGCTSTPPSEIWDWYDLNAIRDNLRGNHILMSYLDSTTDGYTELASPTANGGKGWQPIGTDDDLFTGIFDGQGFEIRDLFINRSNENFVGLFGVVGEGGVVQNIGVVNADVTGYGLVGGLVGNNEGTISNSYSTGSVTGTGWVGGLVGVNLEGTVSTSYSTSDVIGYIERTGGLVGWSQNATVSNSYSTGSVTGNLSVGGLVGATSGIVSNSYSTGSVTGDDLVGGLVGENTATVSNSYSTGSVTGNSRVGGLVGWNNLGTVSDSFWDIQTSGQATSDGGTGKTTEQMKKLATFSGAGWNIIEVANLATRNPSYIWNIVEDVTYSFLSWQP